MATMAGRAKAAGGVVGPPCGATGGDNLHVTSETRTEPAAKAGAYEKARASFASPLSPANSDVASSSWAAEKVRRWTRA